MGIENPNVLSDPNAPATDPAPQQSQPDPTSEEDVEVPASDSGPSVVPPPGDYIKGPSEQEKHEARLRAAAESDKSARMEIEQKFAEARVAIDQQYADEVATAFSKRDAAHAANVKEREDAVDALIEADASARDEARAKALT